MTSVFKRRHCEDTDTQKGECHMNVEAEIIVIGLHAKECQELLATIGSQEEARKYSFLELSEGEQSC